MQIYNESGHKINTRKVEYPEQKLASKLIRHDDVVLELGARYGSVSCTINRILSIKTNQVSVEPDLNVAVALEKNKIINDCEFHIINGFISKTKKNLHHYGYGSLEYIDNNSTIPSFSLEDIKNKTNIDKFNVLVADCEGCLCGFFSENPNFYDELELIIFEKDYSNYCNYSVIENTLSLKLFTKIVSGHQNAWSKRKECYLNNYDYNKPKRKRVVKKVTRVVRKVRKRK